MNQRRALLAALDETRMYADGSAVVMHAEWCSWPCGGECGCRPLVLDPGVTTTRWHVDRALRAFEGGLYQ